MKKSIEIFVNVQTLV